MAVVFVAVSVLVTVTMNVSLLVDVASVRLLLASEAMLLVDVVWLVVVDVY